MHLFSVFVPFLLQSFFLATAVKMQCSDMSNIIPTSCDVTDLDVTKNDVLEYDKVNTELICLSFSNCKFAVFPSKVFQDFSNIALFSMSDNGLKMINMKFFAKAKNLDSVSFKNNSIGALKNKVFFNVPQLKYLGVYQNKLNFVAVNAFLVRSISILHQFKQKYFSRAFDR